MVTTSLAANNAGTDTLRPGDRRKETPSQREPIPTHLTARTAWVAERRAAPTPARATFASMAPRLWALASCPVFFLVSVTSPLCSRSVEAKLHCSRLEAPGRSSCPRRWREASTQVCDGLVPALSRVCIGALHVRSAFCWLRSSEHAPSTRCPLRDALLLACVICMCIQVRIETSV